MRAEIRICEDCGKVVGKYKRFCESCFEKRKIKNNKKYIEKKKEEKRKSGLYKYNKNYGLEIKPHITTSLSPAGQRWATMSWNDLIIELKKFGLSYKQSQIMVKQGTLPINFGVGK